MDIAAYISYHKYKLNKEKESSRFGNELLRKRLLNKTIHLLNDYFTRFPQTNVYLFGSITKENVFTTDSDIDIVVHNARTDTLYCMFPYK